MRVTEVRLGSVITAALLAGFATTTAAQDRDSPANRPASSTTSATAPEAQQARVAVLIADDIRISGDNKLIASGNVEAVYQDRRVFAKRVIYDRKTDKITLEGPISLLDSTGNLVTAESGEIDRSLKNGILRGARVIMDQYVQLAAVEMHRASGRYNQLYRAAVTSCRVCGQESAPLWQIRAERVIHDQQEHQLYFENAQFRVLDVPILYIPRLRLPDPTVDRASGFLIPSFRNSSILGFGIKVPYFLKIGDDKDLTIAPFIATKSETLEYRYRQAFKKGDIVLDGAFSHDKVTGKKLRAYVFLRGEFQLPKDFVLRFGLQASRDKTYLLDHDFSERDRLDSGIEVERVRRDEYIRGAVNYYHSLREDESNYTLPRIATNLEYQKRLFPKMFGGELRFDSALHGHWRKSKANNPRDNDFYGFAAGRDVGRLHLGTDWRREYLVQYGILATVNVGSSIDVFKINQAGNTSKSSDVGVTPYGSVQLRWPWQTATGSGAVHVIEPVVQANYLGGHRLNIPNDESTRVEFDEGNLFSISRFPAPDRWERGFSTAYGLQWTRVDPKGWEASLAAGQIYRDKKLRERDEHNSFTKSSGLREHTSDLLLAGQFRNQKGMALTARGLFDNDFSLNKAQVRGSWHNKRASMSLDYIWLNKDRAEDLKRKISEFSFSGGYRVSRHWTLSGKWRYDLARDKSVRAGLGVRYTNECVDIAFAAVRRFTSSRKLDPASDLSLTVSLRGFSAKTRDETLTRQCRR